MRYQGIIFDLDGTLGDTLPLCVAAFRGSIEPLVGRSLTDAEIVATFGPSEEGTVRALAPENYDEGVAAYLERYDALHDLCPKPFDGIPELIERLKNEGIKVGLVTGKGRRSADLTLRRFGLEFEQIQTGSPAGPRKLQGIREVLRNWQVDAESVLYVGDATSDVLVAREAGIAVVSAAWGDSADADALIAVHPDELFLTVSGLTSWLFFEEDLVRIGQRVQALAQTGLSFTKDRYDAERYHELTKIAGSLLSLQNPRLRHSLRGSFQEQTGYATPKVDVRAIVLRRGHVLLTKEAQDGL